MEAELRQRPAALRSSSILLVGACLANTWIIDLSHYLTPTGAMVADMTPRARRLGGHRRCTGLIQSFPAVAENDDEEAPIVWRCPVCGDEGLISGWQNSLWDGFSNPTAAS